MLIYTCRKTVNRDISAAVPKLVAVCITVAVHWLSLTWTFNTATGEASSCTGTFVNEDTNIDLLRNVEVHHLQFPLYDIIVYYLQKEGLEEGQCLGLLYQISRIINTMKYNFSLCIPPLYKYKSYILCTLNLYCKHLVQKYLRR